MTNQNKKEISVWVDPKFEYLARMFGHRTRRKDSENFFVNMIWQKLLERGCDIEPVTQQIVFGTSGRHYYLDLYFPAVKLAVECDEGQHKALEDVDGLRVKDVLDAFKEADDAISPWKKLAAQGVAETLEADFMRVKTYNSSYEDILRQVEKVVQTIIARKDAAEREHPNSTAWKNPAEDIEKLREKTQAELIAGQSPEFQTIVSAYNIFRRDPVKGIQRGFFPLGNLPYTLWFPQAPKVNDDGTLESRNVDGWINIIQEDFSILEINTENSGLTSCPPHEPKELLPRLTFLRDRNTLGKQIYRFAGIYKFSEASAQGRLYKRIADGVRWTRSKESEFPESMHFFNSENRT